MCSLEDKQLEVKNMNTQQSEKRKSTRIETHVTVKYRKLGDPESKSKSGAITRNISEGGIRFRTAEFLSKACRLIMELDIPQAKPVKIISRVVWISKVPYGEGYETGNQFLEMSRKDRELVSEYLGKMAGAQA